MEALNEVDYDMVEAAGDSGKRCRKTWVKWGAAAACAVLVMTAGVLFLWRPLIPAPQPSLSSKADVSSGVGTSPAPSESGSDRRYRDGFNLTGSECAIVWPWELKTPMERYVTVTYDGKAYCTRGREIHPELLGEKLGVGESTGYDDYTEKAYSARFDVYAIRDVDPAKLVAVDLGESCAVYLRDDNAVPVNFGELLDSCSLPETLPLEQFCTKAGHQITGWFETDAGSEIWKVLSDCRDAPGRIEDRWGEETHDQICFVVTSEVLGIYLLSFSVTEDGYLVTNLMEYLYVFEIGREAAGRIISLAKTNCAEAEMPSYHETLGGILTEIGDGYLLVDDSVLCRNEADGIVYRVLTDDLRVRRCLEFPGDIQVGDLVVVCYEGSLDPENGYTVTGGFSLQRGILLSEGIGVQE